MATVGVKELTVHYRTAVEDASSIEVKVKVTESASESGVCEASSDSPSTLSARAAAMRRTIKPRPQDSSVETVSDSSGTLTVLLNSQIIFGF